MKKEKKAQITIFIILGIILIIILLVLFRGKITRVMNGKSPLVQVQECINQNIQYALNNLSTQGGEINPNFYYLYKGNKVSYLCYTDEYYKTCVMQKPLLLVSIKKEIKDYAEPNIRNCINDVKENLEKKGYKVNFKKLNLTLEFTLNGIKSQLNTDLKITKDSTQSYKTIKTQYITNIYRMLMIAESILNWEATYGDSSSMTYMMYHPSIKVEKKIQGDGTKIYILTDRNTHEKFMFAVRSGVIPPGITGR